MSGFRKWLIIKNLPQKLKWENIVIGYTCKNVNREIETMLYWIKIVVVRNNIIENQEKSLFTICFAFRNLSELDARNKMKKVSMESYSQCKFFHWDFFETTQTCR